MENKEGYIMQLELTIRRFLEPLKGIPFPVCIKALTGFSVLAFDISDRLNKELLNELIRAAKLAGQNAFIKGIFTRRPNEAGNKMEPFVVDALRKVGLRADKPITKSGKKKTAGYPDIQIKDKHGRVVYLDCKTYNTDTKNQSFRTFYFSPSKDPKITSDAFHLLMSFELAVAKRNEKDAYVPISWQLYTLEKLRIQIKHEFNASNRELYIPDALLAHEEIGTTSNLE